MPARRHGAAGPGCPRWPARAAGAGARQRALVHHGPDLMIAGADAATGGRLTWVLGEVHPSIVTSRYAVWLAFHDAPDTVRAALRHDLNGAAVWFAETAELGGTGAQQANVLASPGDLR